MRDVALEPCRVSDASARSTCNRLATRVLRYLPCRPPNVPPSPNYQLTPKSHMVVDRASRIHAIMTGSTRCHSLSYSTRSSILSASIAFCMLEAGT
jgi:hypothetical protein